MRKPKLPLLVRILIAIISGILLGPVIPVEGVRVMITFNGIFNSFLQFIIPLIIIGLVTPAIADIGKGAGKLLLITAALAYVNTVFAISLLLHKYGHFSFTHHRSGRFGQS